MALMVKSRRARSSSSEAPNSTTAWRPSVWTSRRKVVTSWKRCAVRTATVPNRSPTGTVCLNRRWTASGVAAVATSKSVLGSPSSVSRIAPPTHQASNPASSSVRAIWSTSAGMGRVVGGGMGVS